MLFFSILFDTPPMSEYTLKLNELATQDYDKARHKADKETLFNMLKLNN